MKNITHAWCREKEGSPSAAGAAASLKLRTSLPRHADAARTPCAAAVALAAAGTCAGAPAATFNDARPPTALTTLRIMVIVFRCREKHSNGRSLIKGLVEDSWGAGGVVVY